MFWKKKTPTNELFSFESVEKRAYFRVSPPSNQPIHTVFNGQSVSLTTIGAGGVSFCHDTIKVGDIARIEFTLPGENNTIAVRTEVIDVDDKKNCHCRFHGLDSASFDAIHRYVLAVQLEIKRALSSSSTSIIS